MAVTYTSADRIADVPGATYAALQARFRATAKVVDVVSAERKELRDEMCRREKDVAMKIRLGALTAEQKQEYRDIINSPSFSQG